MKEEIWIQGFINITSLKFMLTSENYERMKTRMKVFLLLLDKTVKELD